MADVIVIGDGVIGLAVALELGIRGVRCRVLGANRPGMASTAAAGLLAPSVAELPAAVRPFFFGSLDRFPAFLDRVREFDSTLATIDGLLEVRSVADEPPAPDSRTRLLQRSELADLEPALAHLSGALMHSRDGAVDNVRLVAALARAVAAAPGVDLLSDEPVAEIDCTGPEAVVRTESGGSHPTKTVVIAAGTWSGRLRGLPRHLPISPIKGQMLAVRSAPLRHAVMALPHVYLVPRGAETLVGATSEEAGFDVSATETALARLRTAAVALCPSLADAPVTRAWAGLRPATPDMLPILGADPDQPAVVYACGHSRNGILLAPATAESIGALITGEPVPFDLKPFRADRFGAAKNITS